MLQKRWRGIFGTLGCGLPILGACLFLAFVPYSTKLDLFALSIGYVFNEQQWSPAGDQLAFQANINAGSDGIYQLYVVDADGENLRELVGSNDSVSDFAWSPDGAKIAAILNDFPEKDLFLIDPQSGERQQLTDTQHRKSHLHWSPSGAQLVFASSPSNQSPTIYLIDFSDGSSPALLTEVPDEDSFVTGIAWSEDGDTLFVRTREGQYSFPLAAPSDLSPLPASEVIDFLPPTFEHEIFGAKTGCIGLNITPNYVDACEDNSLFLYNTTSKDIIATVERSDLQAAAELGNLPDIVTVGSVIAILFAPPLLLPWLHQRGTWRTRLVFWMIVASYILVPIYIIALLIF